MKTLLLLVALFLFAIAAPVRAMTEEADHYNGTDQRSQYADPDDSEEGFNDQPHTNYQGQSGREQELLQGSDEDHEPTYGYSSGWSQGSRFGGSSTFYGFH